MALLQNLSFETAALDGITPAHWTILVSSSVEAIDVFADGGVTEGFEDGWIGDTDYVREFTFGLGGDTEQLQFTNTATVIPLFVDGFEVDWNQNQNFDRAFPAAFPGVSYAFSFLPAGQEAFEAGWFSNEDYVTSLPQAEGASLTGNAPPIANGARDVFVGGAHVDGFESGWGNTGFDFAWSDKGGTATGITNVWNDQRESPSESFEYVTPDVSVTFSVSSSTITPSSPVPYSNGYGLQFYSPTGSLPAPFAPNTTYLAAAAFGSSFEASLNGTPVVCTALGTGAVFVTAPFEYWTTLVTI